MLLESTLFSTFLWVTQNDTSVVAGQVMRLALRCNWTSCYFWTRGVIRPAVCNCNHNVRWFLHKGCHSPCSMQLQPQCALIFGQGMSFALQQPQCALIFGQVMSFALRNCEGNNKTSGKVFSLPELTTDLLLFSMDELSPHEQHNMVNHEGFMPQ